MSLGRRANLQRSNLPALARNQLREIRTDARTRATSATPVMARAHWQDVVDRVDGILDPRKDT